MSHKLVPHTKLKSNTSIKVRLEAISSSQRAQRKALSRLAKSFSQHRKISFEMRAGGDVLPWHFGVSPALCRGPEPSGLAPLDVPAPRAHPALPPLSPCPSKTPSLSYILWILYNHHLNNPSSERNAEIFQRATKKSSFQRGFSWKQSVGDINSPRQSTDCKRPSEFSPVLALRTSALERWF